MVRGDIFALGAGVLVNPTNCVGPMGKGLAFQFRQRFPALYRDYRKRCADHPLAPGDLHVWTGREGVLVVCVPTKVHWRDEATYQNVELGLASLRRMLARLPRNRVAVPALGCGEGRLDWPRVRDLILHQLAGLNHEVLVLEPFAVPTR